MPLLKRSGGAQHRRTTTAAKYLTLPTRTNFRFRVTGKATQDKFQGEFCPPHDFPGQKHHLLRTLVQEKGQHIIALGIQPLRDELPKNVRYMR